MSDEEKNRGHLSDLEIIKGIRFEERIESSRQSTTPVEATILLTISIVELIQGSPESYGAPSEIKEKLTEPQILGLFSGSSLIEAGIHKRLNATKTRVVDLSFPSSSVLESRGLDARQGDVFEYLSNDFPDEKFNLVLANGAGYLFSPKIMGTQEIMGVEINIAQELRRIFRENIAKHLTAPALLIFSNEEGGPGLLEGKPGFRKLNMMGRDAYIYVGQESYAH